MRTVHLVRHAQASFGADDYDRLSPRGTEQARVLGRSMSARGIRPDRVVSGDMRRHGETADLCLAEMPLAVPQQCVEPVWNEYDHTAMLVAWRPAWRDRAVMQEELARADDMPRAFQRAFAEAMARWISGEHDGDYSESWAGFRARATAALAQVLDGLADGQTALVFTSGGPIAAIAGSLLGIDARRIAQLGWALGNAGVSRVVSSGGSPRLLTLNECAHFDHDATLMTYR